MIKITRFDNIDAVQFAIKATDKKSAGFKKFVKIKNNTIVGSDGYRLHEAEFEIDSQYEGYYEIIKNTKTEVLLNRIDEDIDFPEYEDLFVMTENKVKRLSLKSDTPSISLIDIAKKTGQYLILSLSKMLLILSIFRCNF